MTSAIPTDLDFSEEYLAVLNSFNSICTLDIQAVKQEVIESTPNVLSVLADQRGRFRIWAGNVGAHGTGKASLQHRLREAPHFRSLIHGLLQRLDKLLTEGVCVSMRISLHSIEFMSRV